jgi:hypothetical protein
MKAEVTSFNSTFFEYLSSFIWFNQGRLAALMERYPTGATTPGDGSAGQPIFWHINVASQIAGGRIVTMDSETGKIYDNSWYYQDGQTTSLFGEHLLKDCPDRTIALVKDEMTAAIMSCFPTPYVWLATGREIATSDMASLTGRTVVLFPDKGEYDRCKEIASCITNVHLHVSDVMESAQGDFQNIAQMVLSQQSLRPTEAEAALMRIEEANPNIARLVKAFDLDVVGISPINDRDKNNTQESEPISEEPEEDAVVQSIMSEQEERWHGRNPECHMCDLSHESINGTYCNRLNRYVEYGKGNCGR